ncbi:MAG: type II toxin-antitoxin system RelE/ParE family toxin [Saprospiraceae bacterium]
MEVKFTKRFEKELFRAPVQIQNLVKEVILALKSNKNLRTTNLDIAFLKGQKKEESFFRIRVGTWRIGAEWLDPHIVLLRILPRGEIYKKFP